MSHIDDCTIVESMTSIFQKFIDNSVQLKDVKVIVIGGWKEHPESFNWGTKILKILNESGFQNVSTKNMYSKKTPTPMQVAQKIPASQITNYYHCGALVDAGKGSTFLLKEFASSLENEQNKQTEEFIQKYSTSPEIELPLTQVTE